MRQTQLSDDQQAAFEKVYEQFGNALRKDWLISFICCYETAKADGKPTQVEDDGRIV